MSHDRPTGYGAYVYDMSNSVVEYFCGLRPQPGAYRIHLVKLGADVSEPVGEAVWYYLGPDYLDVIQWKPLW